MFNTQEILDEEKYKYKTLNKDILISQNTNGLWDFSWNEHDLDSASELDSLQCGIINACLTSWNYMNRYGNPTYTKYGNRAYQQLKENKSTMNSYKIKVFFEEVLNRMRRISIVNDLTVEDDEDDPHKYIVKFKVTCINNEVISSELTVSDSLEQSDSFIDIKQEVEDNKYIIILKLYNEYGSYIRDEFIRIYKYENGSYVDKGITESTNNYGVTNYTYTKSSGESNIKFKFTFNGNSLYNECTEELEIK